MLSVALFSALFLVLVAGFVGLRLVSIARGERSGAARNRYVELAGAWLEPGEQVAVAAIAVPAATASGVRIPAGALGAAGSAIGNSLARAGAVRGGGASIAGSLPRTAGGKLLVLTDHRLLLGSLHAGRPTELLWEVPLAAVAGVRRRPRIQLMARLRLEFNDGSAAAMMTPSGVTAGRLQSALSGVS